MTGYDFGRGFRPDHGSVGTRVRPERHQPVDVPLSDRLVHRRVRLGPGCRPGQARALLRRGAGDVPHRVRPGATCSTPTASTSAPTWASAAPSRAKHIVCPWHGWQWRGDGTNALIPYSKIGCKQNVRIRTYPSEEWYGFIVVWHERHGRAPVLAAAGAARAGNRRVLPAAPAHPDAQPGQGARADDHRERRRPVSRAVRPQGRQPRHHHVVRGATAITCTRRSTPISAAAGRRRG